MAKRIRELFPLGVATGGAHCNRHQERDQLQKNILNGHHTWLWARRRMGKTSLIEQVLKDLRTGRRKVVAKTLDLLVVHDIDELERRIREGVEALGVEILPKGQKTTTKLGRAFKELNPQFSVGAMGIHLKLGQHDSPIQGVSELLMGLDAAAGLYRRRVIMVFDEFQQLSQMKDVAIRAAAEGAIRHAVERAQHITYLFAGSEKHLLASMFEDEDRPLYRLCRKMTLQRISAAAYREFLRDAAKARWRRVLADERIDEILTLTRRHPYYVNALCARLWDNPRAPTPASIQAAWCGLIDEDQSLVAGRVLRLSAAQRAMLTAIAKADQGAEHPASREFLAAIRLPASTGNKSKEILEQADLIHQEEDGRWYLVDPIMAAYLNAL
ncbi:MAG: AAA family ATPase [Gammaproteobacteria bacterium]